MLVQYLISNGSWLKMCNLQSTDGEFLKEMGNGGNLIRVGKQGRWAADLDIDVGLVGFARAPQHQQEEGEDGDERERRQGVAPPRRLRPGAASVLLVLVVPAAPGAAAVPEAAPGHGPRRAAGAELVGEEEAAGGGLAGVVHRGAGVVEVVVERGLGRGGAGERHLVGRGAGAAAAAGGHDVRVGGGGAVDVVRRAARGTRRRRRRQAGHVGVRLGVPCHLGSGAAPRGVMGVSSGIHRLWEKRNGFGAFRLKTKVLSGF